MDGIFHLYDRNGDTRRENVIRRIQSLSGPADTNVFDIQFGCRRVHIDVSKPDYIHS